MSRIYILNILTIKIFFGCALESYYLVTFQFHRYDLKEFVDNGKIVTTLDNGEKVESRPSVLKPNCKLWCILVMKNISEINIKPFVAH